MKAPEPEDAAFQAVLDNIRRVNDAYPDGVHTREELDRLEPGRRGPLLHFRCVICCAERTVDKGKRLDSGSWVCLDHLSQSAESMRGRRSDD